MFLKILSCLDDTCKLFISKHFYYENDIDKIDYINIYAGLKTKTVKVVVLQELEKDTLKISSDVLEFLSIPSNILYQIRWETDGMRIGPIIGLLLSKKNKNITKKKLKESLEYLRIYERVHGLFYVFSYEGIDFKNKLIQGYYLKTSTNNEWEKGDFPFPKVIYRRTTLTKYKIKKLKKFTNNKIFNSYYFNKLTFWNLASTSKTIKKHIPHTCLLSSIDDIDDMLERYDAVYLKPVSGTLANGLIRITKDNDYYFKTNDLPYPIQISKRDAASKYVDRIKSDCRYLVQEAVHSLKFQNRYIDFRVVMQKDETFKWECTAIISRVGKHNGICSNFMEWGYAQTFKETFSKLFHLRENEILMKKQEVIEVCKKACKMLDGIGENYGDLGIDVSIDENYKVWIFEINKNHDHDVVLAINDIQKYHTIKTNPIKYAVALSGFDIM